jgi:hypothetical protein
MQANRTDEIATETEPNRRLIDGSSRFGSVRLAGLYIRVPSKVKGHFCAGHRLNRIVIRSMKWRYNEVYFTKSTKET